MESQEKDYMEIDLAEVFYILKKNLRNIFVVTLCCVLIAAGYAFLQPKEVATYTSEALVRVRQWPNTMQVIGVGDRLTGGGNTKENGTVFDMGYTTVYLNQRLLTYAELLKSNEILSPVNKTIKTIGTVKAVPVKDTEMMKISFSTNDAEKAKKGNELLIEYFQGYLSSREHSEVRYVEKGASDEQKMRVIFAENVRIDVIDAPTLPMVAVATNKARRLIVSAMFLGVLLGCGYAIMRAIMNRRLTTEGDVENCLKLPVLGVVPEEASLVEAMVKCEEVSTLQKIGGFLWK